MSMSKLASIVVLGVICSGLTTNKTYAAETVDNPTCTNPYDHESPIAANGQGLLNTQYTVKLMKGDTIKDEATVTSNGSGYWSHTFQAPGECGDDWRVELWRDGVKKAES